MKNCKQCKKLFMPKRERQIYCSKSCASVEKGRMNLGRKTGPQRGKIYKKQIDRYGYVRVYARLHPYAGNKLMILEHRMLMELKLKRKLLQSEIVHHINHIKTDNRIENLILMNRKSHCQMHGKESNLGRKRSANGKFQ